MGAGELNRTSDQAHNQAIPSARDTPRREEGSVMDKPMSAVNLISCLAGEMFTDPALLVEAIGEDSEVLAIVRAYGKGLATYEQVREAVGAIC